MNEKIRNESEKQAAVAELEEQLMDRKGSGSGPSEVILAEKGPLATVPVDSGPMAMLAQPGIDLDRLERLWALQVKYDDDQARKAFFAAFAAFKATPILVERTQHVNYTTSKGTTDYFHQDLGITIGKVAEAMAPHGLSVRWDVRTGQQIEVDCVVAHAMGHQEITTMQGPRDPSGGKNDIQAIGSTVSYLQRYTLNAACGLAAAGKIDEALLPVSDEEVQWMRDKLIELGKTEENFCKLMKVGNLEGMQRFKYRQATQKLLTTAPADSTAQGMVDELESRQEGPDAVQPGN